MTIISTIDPGCSIE